MSVETIIDIQWGIGIHFHNHLVCLLVCSCVCLYVFVGLLVCLWLFVLLLVKLWGEDWKRKTSITKKMLLQSHIFLAGQSSKIPRRGCSHHYLLNFTVGSRETEWAVRSGTVREARCSGSSKPFNRRSQFELPQIGTLPYRTLNSEWWSSGIVLMNHESVWRNGLSFVGNVVEKVEGDAVPYPAYSTVGVLYCTDKQNCSALGPRHFRNNQAH